MSSMIPVTRPFRVFAIHDEQRGCLLGRNADHWMVISPVQLRDLLLFDSEHDAWAEIAGRRGLAVQEFFVQLQPGDLSRLGPGEVGVGEADGLVARAVPA